MRHLFETPEVEYIVYKTIVPHTLLNSYNWSNDTFLEHINCVLNANEDVLYVEWYEEYFEVVFKRFNSYP